MEATTYPSIVRRYLSTFIDSMFVISMMIVVGYFFQYDNEMAIKSRIAMILFLFFVYEPICTSRLCTIGQKITGIRIRSIRLGEKISIPMAYLRIISKILLGFVSFFIIPFTEKRRALHDLIAGSVVLEE